MNKKLLIVIVVIASLLMLLFVFRGNSDESVRSTWWKFQSIDTMKYSRDLSREKLNDPTFDRLIKQQVGDIAATGATHVGIATPYDAEFYPILERWVEGARKNNLKVWFRGNWSGWEGWFEYPKITREEHIKKTEDFIKKHKDIFEDGDVFTACPECENGGPGDPRHNRDLEGHRKFLIDEYKVTKNGFKAIGKDVQSNLHSMNGDVARLVMDKETTSALDGIVTIDHYVSTPEKLINDIGEISRSSGGKIVLGEFGAPIPDINGNLSEEDQASWIREAMVSLIQMPEVAGLNYWTNTGSSTQLWSGDGTPRKAAEVIKSFYKATVSIGKVADEAGRGIGNAHLTVGNREYSTDSRGNFEFPYFEHQDKVKIDASGFYGQEIAIDQDAMRVITLKKEKEDLWFKIRKFLRIF